MSLIRLDKFLADQGLGTRSEVKKLLKGGTVAVNGKPCRQAELKIDASQDQVSVNGQLLTYEPFVCLMLNKPSGCITATQDSRQKTVMDYIAHERKADLFPVGRLDIDTEGLLLLMNDGDLAHRMLSPRHHVDKTYFVRVEGTLDACDTQAFADGVDIGEKKITQPAQMKILRSGEISEAELTICEGRFHQVKRMFAVRGKQVIYLKRIRMAGIALDETLQPGAWRSLTDQEKEHLLALKANCSRK
jgi:16S rRNA pseudouridine516 synthase